MKAADRVFYESLNSLSRDELISMVKSMHEKLSGMDARESENQRIYTEMYIQYSDLKKSYDALYTEHEQLKALYQKEVDKNTLKTRLTFGRSTEKFIDLVNAAADKTEDFEDESQTEDESREPGRTIEFPGKKPASGRHGKGRTGCSGGSRLKESMKKLPCEIIYDIDTDRLDQEYGRGSWRISFWREHEAIEKLPFSYYVKKIYTPVISTGLEHDIYTVPYMNPLMPHTYLSPSLLAEIIYRKFVLGLPFYRQARDFQMSDLCLSRQVIIHWVNTVCPELLDPVCDYLVSLLVKYRYIQSDETYMQVNKDGKSPGHKSYLWVHCSSELCDCNPIVVFCYEATRGTDHLRHLFGEFLGYITSDAYISYQVMENEHEGITVSGCLMHCRRYFAEAFFVNDVASMSDDEIALLPETRALLLIREIYAEEKKLKELDANSRLAMRQGLVKPKVEKFFSYVHELFKSDDVFTDRMRKALAYAVNQEEKLRVFLNDGNIPCDNGKAERIIRSYSIGRANWLFADTITGANVNAALYSIVETAKANGADVRLYLQYLLEKTSGLKTAGGEYDTVFMESLMPWSDDYKKYEKDVKENSIKAFRKMFPEPDRPGTPLKGRNSSLQDGSPPVMTA